MPTPIEKCNNELCPMCEFCYRYTADKNHITNNKYVFDSIANMCIEFIPNSKRMTIGN
jgi:hypothetical protein